MKSTLGRRASICKELGWTLQFVEHGISYCKLQMIMLDLPRVHYGDSGEGERITMTDDNADDVWAMLFGNNATIKRKGEQSNEH